MTMTTTKIDELTFQEVKYNVYAMAATAKRIERKLERARSDKVIAKLNRQLLDEQIGLKGNVARLARFNRG